jgi:hypothetical protein
MAAVKYSQALQSCATSEALQLLSFEKRNIVARQPNHRSVLQNSQHHARSMRKQARVQGARLVTGES